MFAYCIFGFMYAFFADPVKRDGLTSLAKYRATEMTAMIIINIITSGGRREGGRVFAARWAAA